MGVFACSKAKPKGVISPLGAAILLRNCLFLHSKGGISPTKTAVFVLAGGLKTRLKNPPMHSELLVLKPMRRWCCKHQHGRK
ncbi:hypothetical protein HNR64_002153 [Spongiibacter marinus]|nr:hypothetical protein [Spongiibacter marinus]